MKWEAKMERREVKRRGVSDERQANGGGPTLKERHTDVIGGPEVVGGEERVVLEEMTDR